MKDAPIACPLPWAAPKSPAVSVPEARANLGRFFLLDVREQDEHDEFALPGSTLIPLNDLTESLDRIPGDRPVLCYCAVGGRSARATMILREHGFEAYNLTGGIRSWLMHA